MLNVFKQQSNSNTSASGANQLAHTAQLSTVSEKLTDEITINLTDEIVTTTIQSNDAATKWVRDQFAEINYVTTDEDWMKAIDSNEAIKMLKSQQSKQSRSRTAVLTMGNYKKFITATIAVILLKDNCSVGSQNSSHNSNAAPLELTAELKEKYLADQEALAKAIRNVQSRKSIMKSKADFSEESEKYTNLLAYEEELKALRSGSHTVDPAIAERAKKAEELEKMLSDADIDKMKAADTKKLLNEIKELMLTRL